MKLEGIKAISRYMLLSESTVMDLILRQNLPAKKDEKTATWSATSAAIDAWLNQGKKARPVSKSSGEGVKAGKGGKQKKVK